MKLIVLVGNIGTGKTTYCNQHFKNSEIILRPDDWIESNLEEKQNKLLILLKEHLGEGKIVIVDGNNLRKSQRSRLLFFAKTSSSNSTIIDFGSGNEETLKRRIIASPEIQSEIWKQTHYVNQMKYETPDYGEGYDEIIRIQLK